MRLVTRGDLDGLTCAFLLSKCESIDWVRLVHPQQIVGREVTITSNDILANLPYHPDCGKWFDNARSTSVDTDAPKSFQGSYTVAPSASRVVYEHYKGDHPEIEQHVGLVTEVDRLDSGDLTRGDIVEPKGYILLGLTLDPRSGLGAFEGYFSLLLDGLKEEKLADILEYPEVVERVQKMREQDSRFREITSEHSRQEGNAIITDFRPVYPIPSGNRFLVYTLFPDANVSLRVHWGPARESVIVAVGRSVLNRTSQADIGSLMSKFGGGGHSGAGSCSFKPEEADAQIAEIVAALNAAG